MNIKKGSTDVTTYVNLVDSAAGTPETGLTITNIDATYIRNRAAAVKNDLTALGAANSAHADNQGIEVDSTNAPGIYRIDWPDAAFATGADKVILTVTCSGCAPASVIVQLVNYDPEDAVRLGLTALPNAAADGAGGLPISDAGGLDLDAKLANTNEVTAARMGALTDWIDGGRLDLIIDAILTDTAEIGAAGAGLTVLATAANLATVAGYLDTEIAAILAAVDTEVAAIKAKTDQLVFTTANQVDANVVATVDGKTLIQAIAIIAAAVAGKLSGAGTGTETVVGLDGSTSRAVVTVDSSGNRSAVTYP